MIYMPGRDLQRLQHELLQAGVGPEIACCAISHAATPKQTQTVCTLQAMDALECGPRTVAGLRR